MEKESLQSAESLEAAVNLSGKKWQKTWYCIFAVPFLFWKVKYDTEEE